MGIIAGAINQIQVMYNYGVQRVLLANQLLEKSHLKTIAHYIIVLFIVLLIQLINLTT